MTMQRLVLMTLACILAVLSAPGGRASEGPRIEIDRLLADSPGWLMTSVAGDATEGSAEAEQAIWPMWYLHWFPLDKPSKQLTAKRARKAVARLWDPPVLEEVPESTPIEMPSHPGFVVEAVTRHGEQRTRYIVWACPESGRLIVVDMNLNLQVNAPDTLMQWMHDMARTVRCHPGASTESFPHLSVAKEITDLDLAYAHPPSWGSPMNMRVVSSFGGDDMSVRGSEARTVERGQELVIAMDALRHLHFSWGPQGDFPVSYEVLKKRVHTHWSERALDVMLLEESAEGQVWIQRGIVRPTEPHEVPPSNMNLFRAWLWRQDGTEYFAVGDIGGIRFGRQRPGLTQEAWDEMLTDMFRTCIY